MTLKVHGMILSPWVRRLVLLIMEKGLDFELVNVVPLGEPDPDFLKISPLGKVPVLEIDERYLPDSLAAGVFLDAEFPEPGFFPEASWDRAWMLWLCDFLATGLFSKVEVPLFMERFVNPNFRQTAPDQSIIDAALALMPSHFDYLEGQLADGRAYLLGEAISYADLTAGSIFVNFGHAGEKVDRAGWPRLADYVDRLHGRPSFARVFEMERAVVGSISPFYAD